MSVDGAGGTAPSVLSFLNTLDTGVPTGDFLICFAANFMRRACGGLEIKFLTIPPSFIY